MKFTPEFLKKAADLQKRQAMAANADMVFANIAGIRLVLFFDGTTPEGVNSTEWPPFTLPIEVEKGSPVFAAVAKAYCDELEREQAEIAVDLAALEAVE